MEKPHLAVLLLVLNSLKAPLAQPLPALAEDSVVAMLLEFAALQERFLTERSAMGSMDFVIRRPDASYFLSHPLFERFLFIKETFSR